ncbi:MAG: DUF502 domain-containing protein [Brachymonas sp.]|nr:DUF502 domain-containing protein [Brachymonas sp.]
MFKRRLQQYFLAGLLTWLPLVITVWVLVWLLGMLDGLFTGVLSFVARFVPAAEALSRWVHGIPGIGVLTLGVVIFLTGLLVTNIVGQWLVRQWDGLFTRIPVFRSIYSSVKQLSDTLFAGGGKAFSKVLLVQYPMADSWSVGFLTGPATGDIAVKLPGEHISVYVPTAPNPTSGFMLIVRKSDVIELEMSVDEALKYVISMGVVISPEAAEKANQQGHLPPVTS